LNPCVAAVTAPVPRHGALRLFSDVWARFGPRGEGARGPTIPGQRDSWRLRVSTFWGRADRAPPYKSPGPGDLLHGPIRDVELTCAPALDNGRRSPRKLLGAVLGRLLGGKSGDKTERVAVVAALLPGSRERAAEIIANGAPYGLRLAGFRRTASFLRKRPPSPFLRSRHRRTRAQPRQ
jgi:hypothetical protein